MRTLTLRRVHLPFFLLFPLFAALGFCLLALAPDSFGRVVTHDLYAKVCAGILDIISPSLQVFSQGAVLYGQNRPVVFVSQECDGLESIILLCSALAAFAPSLRGLGAAFLGAILLFFCNVIRIMVLFHLFRYDNALAEAVHLYAGPVFTIFPGLLFFLWVAPRIHRTPSTS